MHLLTTMNRLETLRSFAARAATFDRDACPARTVIEAVLSPTEVVVRGRPTLMFGSNNYLGLTFHPEVIAAGREALERHGSGTTGSRAANGTLAMHVELERELAAFLDKRHGMIFTTGHQANLSVITGICGPGDTVLMDADSHASIYDAARLSRARVLRFRHNDVDSLDRKLRRLSSDTGTRLVVVEGLYSMAGDVSPLQDIVAACRRHGAYSLVDEAHSLGVYGDGGRGWADAAGVRDKVDFLVGTFSKSLGVVGGFCVSDHAELQGLHFLARSYVFTASSSPTTVASARAALAVMSRDDGLRASLHANARRLRQGLTDAGLPVVEGDSPILPIHVGDEMATIRLWVQLLDAGIYANIVLPPVCARDQCLLRVSCTAAHTNEQLDQAIAIFSRVAAEAGLIGTAGRVPA